MPNATPARLPALALIALVITGFALLVVGVAFVYWPAALILAGALLFAAGMMGETP